MNHSATAQQKRWIVHIDVDAFFASVEQAIRPELRGKPVIVGGVPEIRGCVCSASYEARHYGVQIGMSLRQAQKSCPDAVFLPGCYAHYERFSQRMSRILTAFSPRVESASIDDVYLDMTGSERLHGKIEEAVARMQSTILRDIGLPVSLGLASNKMVARIASGLHKPKGLSQVSHGREAEFLSPLPLAKLPGIGRSTERKLNELGIHTIGELAKLPEDLLVRTFGIVGALIHERASGIDNREIITSKVPKSVSRETTFKQDTIDRAFIHSVIKYLCERIGMTLRRHGTQCRTVTAKIRYGHLGGMAKARTLPNPTDDTATLFREAVRLYTVIHSRKVAIRLVGITVSNLIHVNPQGDLLDLDAVRREHINTGMDSIRERYGFNAVDYGDTMRLRTCYAEDEDGLVLKTPSLSR